MKSYRCATCDKPVEYEGPIPSQFPFCGDRCRMVDLGRWFRGDYVIDRDLARSDELPEHFDEYRGTDSL